MAMTAKHKELLARSQKRTKELNDFLQERGDNITAADLTAAHAIRDDLRAIKTEIQHEQGVGALRDEAGEFNDFLTKPTAGMRHQAVIGAKHAGVDEIQVGRRGRHERAATRLLRQSGEGVFGKSAFDAIRSAEYRRSFANYVRHGQKLGSKQFRNLEEGLDPQGGYLAPVEMIARLIQRKATPTNVQGLVSVVNTSRDAVSLPRVNYSSASDDSSGYIYTTGFRATATDENPTSDTQSLVSDSSLFGSVRVPVYTWLIEGVLTNNMVEDAMFDPMAWMSGKFVETVELLRDQMILNGSGVGQNAGILVNPGGDANQPAVVNTGSASALTADGIISISEDVPEQYDDNCRFVYKKTTSGKQIRLLKDSQNRYLFGLGYQDSGLVPGRQKALNGYPVTWSQFMPDAGANTFPLIFGDLQGYTLVNRVGFSVQVLREVAARRNQVIVLGRVRFGGLTLEPWRLRVQKCST